MQEIFKIGMISKPQGVRGEVKVYPLTDDVMRFKNLKEVLIDGTTYKITASRVCGEDVFLTISGINDRNTAELFRNKFLCVNRADAIGLKDNTFFIADLMGAKVFSDGEYIGDVEDITSSKTDYFTVKTIDGKTMRFPFLKDILVNVDIVKGEIYLKKSRLEEVSFYED